MRTPAASFIRLAGIGITLLFASYAFGQDTHQCELPAVASTEMSIRGPAAVTEGETAEYCVAPEIDLSTIRCGTCVLQTDRGRREDACEARIFYKWTTSADKDAPNLQGKSNEKCVTVKGKKAGTFPISCDISVCCDSEKKKGGLSQACARCVGFSPTKNVKVNEKK